MKELLINKNDKKQFWFLIVLLNTILYCLIWASPLYEIPIYFGDSGVYSRIAGEMLNGKVLYKDVFDHKGPFIFFIYLIPALFKNNNILIYLIDCLLYNVIFILNYKSMKLKNNNNLFVFILFFLQVLMLFKTYRTISPEGIGLLSISYINYWMLSKQYLNPSKLQLIICGILTGILFWIKFTFLAYIGVIYLCFIITHIKNKTFNYKYILYPLIGFLIPTVIVLGYFIYNNAITDLINAYFIINTKYGIGHSFEINYNFILLIFMIFSLLIYSLIKKEKEVLFIIISYLILIIPIFIMTKYNWDNLYNLFLGLLSMVSIIDLKIKRKFTYFCTIFILISIFCNIFFIHSLSLIKVKKEIIDLKPFMENIDKEINSIAVLYSLNTNILGEINNINYKYFFTPSLSYNQHPEMWDTIYNDVQNKNLQYVIIEKDEKNLKTKINSSFVKDNNTKTMVDKINNKVEENYNLIKEYKGYFLYKIK